jgi:hypothetical protein
MHVGEVCRPYAA